MIVITCAREETQNSYDPASTEIWPCCAAARSSAVGGATTPIRSKMEEKKCKYQPKAWLLQICVSIVNIYIYIYVCIYMCVDMCVCIYMYIYMCVCVCTRFNGTDACGRYQMCKVEMVKITGSQSGRTLYSNVSPSSQNQRLSG